jgi:hypothetical protein
MVFKLKNNGERIRVDIDEEVFRKNNGEALLQPNEVIIIVKEEIRRIYIWKGTESSVRKKFIASRVAASLQTELVQEAHFHRCKIVSIDEGDELTEFIHHFGFDKKEKSKQKAPNPAINQQYFSYDTETPSNQHKIDSKPIIHSSQKSFGQESRSRHISPNKRPLHRNNKETLRKVLDSQQPPGYKRRHILIGNSELYGSVEKKATIFGKESVETDWEPIKTFSKERLELDGFKLRIYINKELNCVEAIEIFESIEEDVSKELMDEQALPQKSLIEEESQKVIKLTELYRLGPKIEKKFNAIGIESANELLGNDPDELAKQIDGASATTISNWIKEVKELLD